MVASAAQLIVISGVPGTGKSTIADTIARDLRAPVFNWDWLMAAVKPFDAVQQALDSGPRDVYRDVGYALINHLVLRQLQLGLPSIVDCVVRERALRLWSRSAVGAGAPVRVIECMCSDVDVHRGRIEGRDRAIPNWDELDWYFVEQSRQFYEPLPGDKLVLDAVNPLDENIAAVRAYLGLERRT